MCNKNILVKQTRMLSSLPEKGKKIQCIQQMAIATWPEDQVTRMASLNTGICMLGCSLVSQDSCTGDSDPSGMQGNCHEQLTLNPR